MWVNSAFNTLSLWQEESQNSGAGAKLAGDGRFDSPGYSAKLLYLLHASKLITLLLLFKFYIQDLVSKYIIGVMVAAKHQVNCEEYVYIP